MLHIKDIEAFANINEALFRGEGREGDGDLSNHPAVLLARLMAAAQAQAQAQAEQVPSAEVVQLVPESERAAVEDGADSVGTAGHDFDPAPTRPLTMASLFGRMMFGRR
ncbi:hypothetical protein [Azospirillum sp.]|uniref:hypothetical protein n=1 Tax=Azospirillum sp. TaxID=34012 RepID=UPI003D728B8E